MQKNIREHKTYALKVAREEEEANRVKNRETNGSKLAIGRKETYDDDREDDDDPDDVDDGDDDDDVDDECTFLLYSNTTVIPRSFSMELIKECLSYMMFEQNDVKMNKRHDGCSLL